ncbi:hypothetical protein QUF54_00890 [Candidatus Marithioploca araucensis]|uniref:Uncharacterized protein n=1 Tax=Candidatus Marithioploca araucensis TaxID=70273 RepID=A0ABT7VQE8_9GAMM|nr:hypothetical protein [Candidatus Marithioploca araucensis]
MKTKQVLFLQAELELMDKAAEYLRYSYQHCQTIEHKDSYTPDELAHFEALTGRFARLSDLLIQKIFRLIAQFDLELSGTIRDHINRAEKKNLIAHAEEFVDIRELRNNIAYEYDPTAIVLVFQDVMRYCPVLFYAVKRVHDYSQKYLVVQPNGNKK